MPEKVNIISENKLIRYTFYRSYKDIPTSDWNTINNRDNLYLTLTYLSVIEDALKKTIDFWYILFYDHKKPVGIAYTQLIKINPSQLKNQKLPCKLSDSLKNFFIKNIEVKTLVCGNLFACGEHGFIFESSITNDKALRSVDLALKDIRKVSHPEDKPSFILLKEFWQNDSNSTSGNLKKLDYRDFEVDVNMVLSIKPNWKSLEDYLGDLKTKFRTRVKKTFEKSSAVVIKNLSYQEIKTHSKTIDELYISVIENADFKFGNLNANTFIGFKEKLKERFIFKAFFLNDIMVGFSTAFLLNNRLEANHIGLDYQLNKTYHLYQRMLYDYVEMAILYLVDELILGRTAETIKSSLGAEPIHMKLFVKHGNSISNTLLKPLVDFITPNDYELRNPFKIKVS